MHRFDFGDYEEDAKTGNFGARSRRVPVGGGQMGYAVKNVICYDRGLQVCGSVAVGQYGIAFVS